MAARSRVVWSASAESWVARATQGGRRLAPLGIIALALFQGGSLPRATAQNAVEQLADEVARNVLSDVVPSVVAIEFTHSRRFPRTLVVSGAVWDERGHVVTVGLPADVSGGQLKVTDYLQRQAAARWIGFNQPTGLALLIVEDLSLKAVRAEDQATAPNETVFLISGMQIPARVRVGHLHEGRRAAEIKGHRFEDLLEFTAPMKAGDNGALLVNQSGAMIGLVRARVSPPAGGPREPQVSRGVAVPVKTVQRVAEQLANPTDSGKPGYLGIVVEEIAVPGGAELRVVELAPGAPAAQAGILVGDVLRKLHEQPVQNMEELSGALGFVDAKDPVFVHVERKGELVQFQLRPTRPPARLGSLPLLSKPELAQPSERAAEKLLLGAQVQDLDDSLREQLKLEIPRGIVIVRVMPGSPAQRAGLRPLDVIVALEEAPLSSADELVQGIRKAGSGKPVMLEWVRGGQTHQAKVVLGDSRAGQRVLERRQGVMDHRLSLEDEAASQQVDRLQRRIEALHRYIEELEQRLKWLEPSSKDRESAP